MSQNYSLKNAINFYFKLSFKYVRCFAEVAWWRKLLMFVIKIGNVSYKYVYSIFFRINVFYNDLKCQLSNVDSFRIKTI